MSEGVRLSSAGWSSLASVNSQGTLWTQNNRQVDWLTVLLTPINNTLTDNLAWRPTTQSDVWSIVNTHKQIISIYDIIYALLQSELRIIVQAGYIQVGYIKIRIYQNDFLPPAKVLVCVTKNLTDISNPDISKSANMKAIFGIPNWQLTSDIYISISCPLFEIHAFENGDFSLTFTARDDEIASRGQGVWHRYVKFKLLSCRCQNENWKNKSVFIHTCTWMNLYNVYIN